MPSDRVPAALRRQVRIRARELCEYCRCLAHFTNAAFHCEHIIPRDAGGQTILENLAWACPWCNAHKYNKTHALDSQTGRRVPLFNPRHQHWARHFTWSEDFLVVIGRTATGRATVEAMHLNRPELINQASGVTPGECASPWHRVIDSLYKSRSIRDCIEAVPLDSTRLDEHTRPHQYALA